jgi:C_GCAxxG_C_C family probable redox protein
MGNDEATIEAAPAAQAVALFRRGLSCSQAVMGAFCGRYGLDQAAARKVSCAFGGGMASTGGTCGAVTGAMMVIGLAHGRVEPEDVASKERTYALTRRLCEEFRARRGSVVCRELLGIDIGTPEGSRRAKDAGLFKELCPALVEDAARILEGLL